MADKVPIRAGLDGSSVTGLAIFASGETIGVAHGGTGLATIGSNQLVTGNGTSAMTSESDLTFDGTTLATTAFTATGNVSLDGGTFIFNESGADKDFRIEGDSEANLFISDASTDRIGIGTATPSHLLDVEGVAHVATCIITPKICISSEYALPAADGSAGQILCTDGSGTIAFAAAASSGHTIAEEGTPLASRTCLNFVGAAVTATDNSGTNATDVTVCATGALLGVRMAGGTACCITLTSANIGGCLQNDTSPTLGGNLDVNGNSIISASNGNIPITPNGSGIAIIDGICHPTADGSAGQVLCTNGSAALQWATLSAGVTLNGSTDNTIATVTGSNALQGEANLTFDGTTLNVVGNAGVGLARTDGTLHVTTSAVSGASANSAADDLVVEVNGNGGMSILTPNTGVPTIAFGDPEDSDVGRIYYRHSCDSMEFFTNATEAMRINNEGVLGIKTIPTSGWHTDHGVLQIGTGAFWVDPHDESAASNMVFLSNNLYRDHADEWRAIVTDEITRYYQYNGEHYFDTSAVTTAGAAMSGNSNKLKIANDGAITMPVQPSFNASVSYNSQSNVTGDATNHTIVFDSEVFDRGGDYNTSTGVFTAPVTGLYQISATVQVMGVTSGMNDSNIGVTTSNGGFTIWQHGGSGMTANFAYNGSMLEDMDAGDTAYVTVDFRNGSKVVDVWTASQFSAVLIA